MHNVLIYTFLIDGTPKEDSRILGKTQKIREDKVRQCGQGKSRFNYYPNVSFAFIN